MADYERVDGRGRTSSGKTRWMRHSPTREAVGWFLLAVALGFGLAAFGLFMGHREEEGGGSHHVKIDPICIPTTAAYTQIEDTDMTPCRNVTAATIVRTGDLVRIDVTFNFRCFPGDAESFTAFFATIDARCVPPSATFAPPSTDPPYDPLLNYSRPYDFTMYSAFITPGSLDKNQTIFLQTPLMCQGVNPSGVLMYGVCGSLAITNPGGGMPQISLDQLALSVQYVTNASSSWTVPDFCKGGQCDYSYDM